MIKILELAPSYHFYQRHIPFFITVVSSPFFPMAFPVFTQQRVHHPVTGAPVRSAAESEVGMELWSEYRDDIHESHEAAAIDLGLPGMVFRRTQVPQKRGFEIHLFLKK